MNIIKGLLTKDLLQLKSYKKNFLISILIYGLIIVINAKESDMSGIGSTMIMFLFSIYAMSTFNYDEKSKADRYILTLPQTKKEVILAKYILGVLSLIIGAAVGLLISCAITYISIQSLPNIENLLSTLLASMIVLSLMQCIQIPFIYKYGAEKGRLQIYIILMFVALLIGLIYMFFPTINLSILDSIENFLPVICIFLIIINYLVSYKISCKIYSKKEV